jgi:hypothetical protein
MFNILFGEEDRNLSFKTPRYCFPYKYIFCQTYPYSPSENQKEIALSNHEDHR